MKYHVDKYSNEILLNNAVSESKTKVFQSLISKVADINFTNKDGKTLLIIACEKGNVYIAEYLIQKGADVNICDRNGMSPLHKSCNKYASYKIID